MSAKKTTKTKATKATKAAKAPATKTKAKAEERTGDAPQSQLDLEETKKLEAARAKKAKAKPADGEPKKLSALDAAARLLAETKQPMNCKEMINAISAKGYWTSPGGKTPHATLYSAILRELATKGKEARFVKTERGKFAYNG